MLKNKLYDTSFYFSDHQPRHAMKDLDYKGTKITRREFLKLLGIGIPALYFAYRFDFINGILGNSTKLRGAYTEALTAEMLDEDGILMMGIPKPGGYTYRFDITKDPTFDKRLEMAVTHLN